VIGVDTNIIVRYLVQDDPVQSPVATDLIERRLTEAECGFVSLVAKVELVWVLDRTYRFAARDIALAVERLLQTDVLKVEAEQQVFVAMLALREGRGTFADALIGALNERAGCFQTVTFDIKALRLKGFEPL
jgi:predicted nucleic-acid-binding protein